MRVLHVTDTYLPGLGGIELHVHDLVAEQRRRGDDVHVATATAPGPAGRAGDPPWVHRLPSRRELARHLDLTAYDALHVHVSIYSPLGVQAVRLATTRGLPTAVTVHSMWQGIGPVPELARALVRPRAWPVAWSAVSGSAAAALGRVLGPDLPVQVVPNAIDAQLWRVPARSPAVPTIVSVMRLTRTKRAEPLVEILREVRALVPDDIALRAVVIGDGARLPAVRRLLRRHAMDDWVDLPGRLTRPEIRDQLACSSVFLAPAVKESFGIAALEARCTGLPVVASSRGGVGEFVISGREGLLAPDDAGLARATARLVVDGRLHDEISRHNRDVEPSCTWDQACLAAGDLYLRAGLARGAARHRRPTPHRAVLG